jgi:hypothetical protein
MTLLDYIKEENHKTEAWINSGPNRWQGLYSEDLNYWAEKGIFTAHDLKLDNDRYMLYETVATVYNKSYARGMDIWNMSVAMVDENITFFSKLAQDQFERDVENSNRSVNEFESKVKLIIESGAGDRETALRWLIQDFSDHNLSYGGNYATYHFDLPPSYIKEFDKIMEKQVA